MGKKLGLPVIESYHTFFEEYLFHYVPFLPAVVMRYLARRFTQAQCNGVEALIVPSTPMLQRLRAYGVKTPATVLPTGIETSRFAKGDGMAFKHRHGIDPARPLLIHVGRVAHEKNIDFLLDMLAIVKRDIPDVLLVIAGEGPALPHIMRRSKKFGLGEHVQFVGYLSREDALVDCYAAGDAFVFASRTETQGLVLLEAMAVGLPVVSTAVMGTRDILSAQKGALVAEDNTEHFAAQVVRVLTDHVLRRRLSREAREYVQSWSPASMATKSGELYRTIVEGLPLPEHTSRMDSDERLVQMKRL